jgi:hypothetical protein
MSEVKEGRTMKISRALTRITTIDAQLGNIYADIQAYAAGNSKKVSRLSNKKVLAENHAESEKEMRSKFQQFKDLVDEKVKIRLAINAANAVTVIEVGGRTMTIAEAIILSNRIMPDYTNALNNFNFAVRRAENDVIQYNAQFSKIEDDAAKAALFADVAYFVKFEEIKSLNEFVTVFKAEINGTLNEVNAVTDITIY